MTIEELEDKHSIIDNYSRPNYFKKHTNLSIEYTISVLEESITETSYHEIDSFCRNKIQELKQYLEK